MNSAKLLETLANHRLVLAEIESLQLEWFSDSLRHLIKTRESELNFEIYEMEQALAGQEDFPV